MREMENRAGEDFAGLRIKICGLSRMEDIEAVNEAKPDYCGFIVEYEKSFRSISVEQLRRLVSRLDPSVLPVGVFVNAPIELPVGLLLDGTLALAQLHGQEDGDYVGEVRERGGKPVIKAFSVKGAADIDRALQSPADYILLDQGSGGTGKPFDWSLVPEIRRPYFLAGGLGEDNLREAIMRLHPYAVDVNSGVETDGKKDREKILRAVGIAREFSGKGAWK